MKIALTAVAAVLALAGCATTDSGAKPAAAGSSSAGVTIHGSAMLTDRSATGYGFTPDGVCGAGDGATAAVPAPLTFTVEVDGAQVYNGQTEQGRGTDDGQCRFAFTAPNLPTASAYDLYVGGQLTRVPSTDAAAPVTVELNG